MKDLITVIINVYNGEKFINKCLDCIINQTYKNLEILIVNDGSTDNTLKICKSYKDKRIRIITTENLGLSLSRNIGIDNAKGEYLYFIDVDDFIEPDTIEYLYNLCKKYDVKMSSCRAIEVYNFHSLVDNKKEKIDILSSEEMLKKILLSEDVAVAIWNKLIHTSLFDNVRFEHRIANDVVVTYKLVLLVDNIVYSNKIKYYYLKHGNSITHRNNADRAIDLYEATLERYYYIKNIYPDLIENEIGTIIRIMYTYFNEKEKVQNYLKKQEFTKVVRKIFSFKILKSDISLSNKIKFILFYISPSFYRKIRRRKYKNNNL